MVFGEGEETIDEIARTFEIGLGCESIRNVAYRDRDGKFVVNSECPVLTDLNKLSIPVWDLIPLDLYWKIGEPHGGTFEPGTAGLLPFDADFPRLSFPVQVLPYLEGRGRGEAAAEELCPGDSGGRPHQETRRRIHVL